MKENPKFKVGDVVEWTSASGGYGKTKRGKIVATVTVIGENGMAAAKQNGFSYDTHNLASMDSGGSCRDHESYLVEVNDSKTGKGKPKLYWPRVSALKAVM